LPRRRFRLQKQIFELVRHLAARPPSFEASVAHSVSPELLPALRLADRLSEFPAVGGNRFVLLPLYDAAIDAIIRDVDRAQRYVHLLFYIYENDEVGRRVTEALARAARRGCRGARAHGCDRLAAGAEAPRAAAARRRRRGRVPDAVAPVGTERGPLRPSQPSQARRGGRKPCLFRLPETS
jgi:phosphatidylserine/phosphatidylglycerophosphate/cardiolipin synthase-like enzyme